MTVLHQIARLFILAIPVACIAWTVTHEEIFKEPRSYCIKRSKEGKSIIVRKFFYLFTCEYCFSHYVALLILFFAQYQLLYADWRGYFVAFFSIVWVANMYMTVYCMLRTNLKLGSKEADVLSREVENTESQWKVADDVHTNSKPVVGKKNISFPFSRIFKILLLR